MKEGAKGKIREEGSRDVGFSGDRSRDGTCTITRGWCHVFGVNSPFARHNRDDVTVGST